jgi:hypothetical protein
MNKEKWSFQGKKGISEVVTILLIVLLALAAIAIVWQVVMPLISRTAGEITTSCITAKLEIQNPICTYNNNTEKGNIEFSVARSAGEVEINSLKFLISDADNSEVLGTDEGNIPNELETRKMFFDNVILEIVSIADVNKISVAPIVALERGDEKTCDIAASKAITCIAE